MVMHLLIIQLIPIKLSMLRLFLKVLTNIIWGESLLQEMEQSKIGQMRLSKLLWQYHVKYFHFQIYFNFTQMPHLTLTVLQLNFSLLWIAIVKIELVDYPDLISLDQNQQVIQQEQQILLVV